MDQHPIPRQITTFEFKLIGFMTLKQFLYLVIFIPTGAIVYFLIPIPLLNIIGAIIPGLFGAALAFVPIQDKPLDEWIKHLWLRMNSPTQYFYHKYNPAIAVFNDLYYMQDPHQVYTHVTSSKMLADYLASTKQIHRANAHKQTIQRLLEKPGNRGTVVATIKPVVPVTQVVVPQTVTASIINNTAHTQQSVVSSNPQMPKSPQKPYFTGVVKNNRKIPLSGILIYMKDAQGHPIRLLKSNPYGVFATFTPCPDGDYVFELKDPKNTYFFDTMNIRIQASNNKPLEFCSKETL